MKKIVCILSIVGVLMGVALFIGSLSVPLNAKPQDGYYGWAIDRGDGTWYCYPHTVIDCWSR